MHKKHTVQETTTSYTQKKPTMRSRLQALPLCFLEMSYHAQCKAMLKFGISVNERENQHGLIETIPKPCRVHKWNLPNG